MWLDLAILVVVVLVLGLVLYIAKQQYKQMNATGEAMSVLRSNAKGGVKEMGNQDVYRSLLSGA